MDVAEWLDRVRPTSSDGFNESPADVTAPDDISGLDDILAPDPRPKRAGDTRGAALGKKIKDVGASTPMRVTVKQKTAITDALTMIQLMVGGGIQFRDPHCGDAIVQNAETVADKALPIICRNPAWVAWFTGGTGWLDVLGLLIALKPVLGTFWGHHVTHTIGQDGEGDGGDSSDFSAFQAPSL